MLPTWAWLLIIALVALVVWLLARRPQTTVSSAEPAVQELLRSLGELGGLRSQVETISQTQTATQQALHQVRTALVELQGRVDQKATAVQTELAKPLQELQRDLASLQSTLEARKRQEEQAQDTLRKIEAVIVGASSRGAAGERVLEEALAQFPPEMVDRQFRVNGRTVEYALVLPGGKRIPIDSKWPARDLLEALSQAAEPEQQKVLTDRIEKEVLKKVAEVTKYIDPATTTDFAVAAVPDAVYFACGTALSQAAQQRVRLIPYSLVPHYLLDHFQLQLRYARAVDVEHLEHALSQIEANLGVIDRELENSVERGAKMVSNAFNEIKDRVADIRRAVRSLHSLPPETVSPQP